MINKIKNFLVNNYFINYIDVPKGTEKIIPLVIIESLAISVSYLISIYLVNSLHFAPLAVGKLISMFSLGTCAGSLVSGYLTTRVSVIKVSSLGLFMYAMGFFFLSFVTSYSFLLVILFLCGISGIFMMIGNLTALIKLADNDVMQNRIIVLQSVIFNLSFSVSSFFMSYLQAQSLRTFFLLFGFMLLISGIFVLNFKTYSTPAPTTDKKASLFLTKTEFPSIIMIISMIFLYGIMYSLVKIYFPVETVSRFHNSFYSWLILSINPLMIIFLQPLLIGRLKNKGNIFLLLSGSFLLGVGYAFFGISTYLILSILFILLATCGEMLFSPISKKLVATSFGYGNEGIGLAVWKMTYYFSGVLGAIFIGYLGENFRDLNIWLVCLPLSLALIICIVCYSAYVGKLQAMN